MKILFLSQGLPFPVYQDGLTVRVYHLLREFSRFADVHIIAFCDHHLTEQETAELCSMASFDLIYHKNPNGLLGVLKKVTSERRYYSKQFEDKVRLSVEEYKPDIVFCEQTFMAQYADAIGSIPKVMSAVDAISLAALRQASVRSKFSNFLSWRYVAQQRSNFENEFFPKFDRITVVSSEDADFLSSRINRDVIVIPNGVNTDYFAPEVHWQTRDTVLFTGNLSAPANEEACEYLIREVFPLLHSQYPDINLEIAGRSPTNRIYSLKPNYVNVRANMPDIREAYRSAICCVSPISIGTGIKNNVLQAMAMGLPVIVTPLIAEPIDIEHGVNGLVAERGAEFVSAIKSILSNITRAKQLGCSGRVHVEQHFSWYNVGSLYMKMFQDVLLTRQHNTGQLE